MLEALKATKGAGTVIERVPMLERPEVWEEMAYFDVRGWSGAATALTLWDADFDGFFNMQQCLNENFALFTGTVWDTEFGAPGTATGRVCCFFEAPRTDVYILNVQLVALEADSSRTHRSSRSSWTTSRWVNWSGREPSISR